MATNKKAYFRNGNISVSLGAALDPSEEFEPAYFRFISTRFSICDGAPLSNDHTTDAPEYGMGKFLTFADVKAFLKKEIATLSDFAENPEKFDAFNGFSEALKIEKIREILGAWQGLESVLYDMAADGVDFDKKLMAFFHAEFGENHYPNMAAAA